MRSFIALLCLFVLVGCGQPYSRAEFEADHPKDQGIDITDAMPTDKAAGLVVMVYPGMRSQIDPVTGAYELEHGIRVVKYRDGIVVSNRWQRHNRLMP